MCSFHNWGKDICQKGGYKDKFEIKLDEESFFLLKCKSIREILCTVLLFLECNPGLGCIQVNTLCIKHFFQTYHEIHLLNQALPHHRYCIEMTFCFLHELIEYVHSIYILGILFHKYYIDVFCIVFYLHVLVQYVLLDYLV